MENLEKEKKQAQMECASISQLDEDIMKEGSNKLEWLCELQVATCMERSYMT
jgi:hypothetical protein